MKHLILLGGITVILTQLVWAQPEQPQPVWGMPSNGICGGICVTQSDWPTHANDFYCDIDVRNMSTKRLYIWLPPLEQRYEIDLRGPDGRPIRQLKSVFLSQKHPFGLEPFPDWYSVDWFFLKDTFDVRTNGQFTLIVSVRANAFTNFAVGRSQMQNEPSYFLLPPVTNTFNILPVQLKN